MEIPWLVAVGLLVGWAVGKVVERSKTEIGADLFFGVCGALLFGYLFHVLGFFAGAGIVGSLLVAAIGAIALLAVWRRVKRV
jgi:uncharacterized membrane protein YeaQ/YmgE (transglycosylase-associated protein family)